MNKRKVLRSNNPTLPIPAQQSQDLPLTHGVFARELEDSAVSECLFSLGQLGSRSEFQADAMGQFLAVEVRGIGRLEV